MFRISALFVFSFISVISVFCTLAMAWRSPVPKPRVVIEIVAAEIVAEVAPQQEVEAPAPSFEGCPWARTDMGYVTMMTESRCNPDAIGSLGEIGLGQIRYEIWGASLKEAGIIRRKADLWSPKVNARATEWILKSLPGSERSKFRAYNGSGPKARAYADKQMRKLNKRRNGGII